MTSSDKGPVTDAENKEMYDLALRGLTLLSSWTQRVMELVSRTTSRLIVLRSFHHFVCLKIKQREQTSLLLQKYLMIIIRIMVFFTGLKVGEMLTQCYEEYFGMIFFALRSYSSTTLQISRLYTECFRDSNYSELLPKSLKKPT